MTQEGISANSLVVEAKRKNREALDEKIRKDKNFVQELSKTLRAG